MIIEHALALLLALGISPHWMDPFWVERQEHQQQNQQQKEEKHHHGKPIDPCDPPAGQTGYLNPPRWCKPKPPTDCTPPAGQTGYLNPPEGCQ